MKRKKSIADIVAEEGIAMPETPEKTSSQKAEQGVHIKAENMTLHLNAGDVASMLPQVLHPSKMTKEDKAAYEAGQWDGINRRTEGEDSAAYKKAISQRAQRKSDRQELLFHYGTLCGLVLIASIWILVIVFNSGVLNIG